MSHNINQIDPQAVAHLTSLLSQSDSARIWHQMDSIYSSARRYLDNHADVWRTGPERVITVASDAFEVFAKYGSITGKTHMDLGCGRFHPYGTNIYFYVNGVDQCYAIDDDAADPIRAAEAIYDTLCDALARPEVWKRNTHLSYEEYMARIRRFNLPALRQGKLKEGLNGLPFQYDVGAAEYFEKNAPEAIDLVTSRSVLEHCMDLPAVLEKQYSIMSSGGLAYHRVDLVDHRFYEDRQKYHYWYFLTDNDPGHYDGLTNRLRCSEVIDCVRNAGFELDTWIPHKDEVPAAVRAKISPEFRHYSNEDLETTGVELIIRKP